MQIGKTIRKYRKEKGITQEEMANRLGVTTPAVNKWEKGTSCPDITLLAPIARLLGISMKRRQKKISTGTVTMVTETLFMIIKQTNWQIHLKKWSNTFMLPNTKTL